MQIIIYLSISPSKNPTMNTSLTFTFLCFIFISFNVGSSSDDTVSMNCGSTGTSSAYGGTKWLGDVQPRVSAALLQLKGSSTSSTASTKLNSADPVPYKTARLSLSHFSYAFQVNPGQKIIRLHFNPSPYNGFKGLKDLFTVEAGPFTLLGNFSATLTASALGVNSLTKEFSLNMQDKQLFHITFSAETSQSKDAYAFINGIEIISVPAALSYIRGGDIGLQVVGRNSLVNVDNSIALEIIHRLNTKQDLVSCAIFGTKEVGNSNNVSWKVSVDVGFRYLVRIHFSKLGIMMAEAGVLKFKVFVNEMIVDINSDIVVKERGGSSIHWYGDYIVMMKGHKREGKRDILICLQSEEEFMDGPLKGFEILKLSNHDNSLASPVPMPPSRDSTSQTIQIVLKVLGNGNAIGTVVIAILSIICLIVHKLREISEASSSEVVRRPSARAERLCRRFSLSEMQLATRNFSDGLLIGRGGFGKVYKGLIDRGRNTVAVKRLKPNSSQGAHEFLMEIETLSELRHINLVSLIGYCSEGREMILVYEYMARGTLDDHLYNLGTDDSSLTWKQRLNICIGAARGLDYLHTGHRVIHRDVKTCNILLDENFVAKVSDFGLARAEDRSKLQSHVSTKVKGTFGYLDPYYFTTRKLTRKSDTFAFGVVLLEVLCGRAAVDSSVPDEEQVLTTWARDKIRKGEVGQIVASSLRGEVAPNSLKTFVGITERCLNDEPKNRPTMSQVVLELEAALDQQDNQILRLDDGVHPLSESQTAVPTEDFIDTQNLTPPLNQQTKNQVFNSYLVSGSKHKGKSTRNKTSRFGLWDALWKRAKPSEYELLFSGVNLLKFDWDQIAVATNHFSSSMHVRNNVYKAVFPSGEVVAVKKYPRMLSELTSEINVLPNLVHRNIIKLHGYCINREDILLVYEFMEHALDYIGQQHHLEWGARFHILMGIAQGLVYLHHDLVPRVIHRNLSLRNILLDSEMNPKITSFGCARQLLELNQSEVEILVAAGAFGYMAPDSFWGNGKISVKTDVFSFGIILLQIVNGTKDGFIEDKAWELWYKGRAAEIVDASLGSAFPEDEAIRCIQVALLCIQDHPEHRPTMPTVIKMLQGNERMMLPFRPEWLGGTTSNIV